MAYSQSIKTGPKTTKSGRTRAKFGYTLVFRHRYDHANTLCKLRKCPNDSSHVLNLKQTFAPRSKDLKSPHI